MTEENVQKCIFRCNAVKDTTAILITTLLVMTDLISIDSSASSPPIQLASFLFTVLRSHLFIITLVISSPF
jgi:hypothetical protein